MLRLTPAVQLPESPAEVASPLDRDRRDLEQKIAALINAMARRHPGFQFTAIDVDYFVRSASAPREYLVDLHIRI